MATPLPADIIATVEDAGYQVARIVDGAVNRIQETKIVRHYDEMFARPQLNIDEQFVRLPDRIEFDYLTEDNEPKHVVL